MRLKSSLLFALCLTSMANAQVTFPQGEVYGYLLKARALAQFGGFSEDFASNFYTVAAGDTSLSMDDSVDVSASGFAAFQNPFEECGGTVSNVVQDPGQDVPGIAAFTMNATQNSIDFQLASETKHRHTLRTTCCDDLTGLTQEAPFGGPSIFFMPFQLLAPVTMTINDISAIEQDMPMILGSGNYSWQHESSLQVDLYVNAGNWFKIGSMSDSQFTLPMDFPLNPGKYALAISYTQAETLQTSLGDGCSQYFDVTVDANNFASMSMSFQLQNP